MILNISGRTDIPAFYSKWFINRYREAFFDVRNPFNSKSVSRIYLENVEAICFCSKNPKPIIPYLKEITKPILFHITLTPYHTDIEPNVTDKKAVIEDIKQISSIIGIENVFVRYDPIFLSDRYTVEYHKKAFEKMCESLDGYVNKIIISFIDEYKNVKENSYVLKKRAFTDNDYEQIGRSFSKSASLHHMTCQTCFEDINLVEYGFIKGECLSHQLAYMLTGKKYPNWNARKEKKCECVQMVDVGAYNSCYHYCKYCYANYNEREIEVNMRNHHDDSTMLIGYLEDSDKITIRKK